MADDSPGWRWIAGCAVAVAAFLAGGLVEDIRVGMQTGRQMDSQVAALQAEVARLQTDVDRLVSIILPLVMSEPKPYLPRTGVDDP